MKTVRNTIIAVIIMLIAISVYLVWPRYDEPDMSPRFHTYEDVVNYARSIDNGATVYEAFTDETIDGHVYRIWPAIIFGKACKVASVPEEILGTSLLSLFGGFVCKDFYRLDNNYDYLMVSEALKEHSELGDIISSEFSEEVISQVTMEKISDEEYEKLKASYDDLLRKMLHNTKSYTVAIYAGDEEIHLMNIGAFREDLSGELTYEKIEY